MTAKAAIPGFRPSSPAAALVIAAVTVTEGDISRLSWLVVAPGFTGLMVPAI